MRLTFSDALNVSSETDTAKSEALIEARRTLQNSIDEAYIGHARLTDEIRRRQNAARIREMNAELPAETRELLKLKGMI